MEIPVQFVTINKPITQLLKQSFVEKELNFVRDYPQSTKFVEPEEYVLPKKSTFEKELYLNTIQKWFTTVELDQELTKRITQQQLFSRRQQFELQQQLTQPRNLLVKVDPLKRIVIVKIVNVLPELQSIKKVIQVPEFVNIQQLKVRLVTEKRLIVIKAPHMNLPTTLYTQKLVQETTTLLENYRELEMERVLELEPTLYKLLQQIRQQLPSFVRPRFFRHLQTGLYKIVLDVTYPRSALKREQLLVKVNELERSLVIRLPQQRDEEQQQIYEFLPKQLLHELYLPTLIDLRQIVNYPVSEKCLRIELPIVPEFLRRQQQKQQQKIQELQQRQQFNRYLQF